MKLVRNMAAWLLLSMSAFNHADSISTVSIHLDIARSGTLYVAGSLSSDHSVDLLLDTGSSYTIITSKSFEALRLANAITYQRDIIGVMADGRERKTKVYMIKEMAVGNCRLNNIEAVVLGGQSVGVLGINALKQLSPFSINTNNHQMTAQCAVI